MAGLLTSQTDTIMDGFLIAEIPSLDLANTHHRAAARSKDKCDGCDYSGRNAASLFKHKEVKQTDDS